MSTRIEQLQERVEAMAPAMVEHYRVRLEALVRNRAGTAAFEDFERKLKIAEELGQPRTTPAMRLKRGRQ